jgi:hypothetical protein
VVNYQQTYAGIFRPLEKLKEMAPVLLLLSVIIYCLSTLPATTCDKFAAGLTQCLLSKIVHFLREFLIVEAGGRFRFPAKGASDALDCQRHRNVNFLALAKSFTLPTCFSVLLRKLPYARIQAALSIPTQFPVFLGSFCICVGVDVG